EVEEEAALAGEARQAEEVVRLHAHAWPEAEPEVDGVGAAEPVLGAQAGGIAQGEAERPAGGHRRTRRLRRPCGCQEDEQEGDAEELRHDGSGHTPILKTFQTLSGCVRLSTWPPSTSSAPRAPSPAAATWSSTRAGGSS